MVSAQTGQEAKRTWVTPVVILTVAMLLIALVIVLVRQQTGQAEVAESPDAEGPTQV